MNEKVTKYDVIRNRNLDRLIEDVQALLYIGWETAGGIGILPETGHHQIEFFQALTYTEEI